jgi:hypothetical protein
MYYNKKVDIDIVAFIIIIIEFVVYQQFISRQFNFIHIHIHSFWCHTYNEKICFKY